MIGGAQDRIYDILNDEVTYIVEEEIKELQHDYIIIVDVEMDKYDYSAGNIEFTVEAQNTDLGVQFVMDITYCMKTDKYTINDIEEV